jgi:hypothetical protein
MGEMSSGISQEIPVMAKLRPGLRRGVSAGFNEGLQMSGNLRGQEPVKIVFIPGGLELPFFDRYVQDKPCHTVKQRCNDSHVRHDCRTPQRSDRRLTKDGIIFFERTVGPFSGRSRIMQLPITVTASGDLQHQPWMLGNRNMRAVAKPVGTMGAVPVKLKIGCKLGFDALFEAGEGKPLRRSVKSIEPSGEMTVRNIRPSVTLVTSFYQRFKNQLFIPGGGLLSQKWIEADSSKMASNLKTTIKSS